MEFLEAVLHANSEISLHVKRLKTADYQSHQRGAGGDISSGIDLVAESIFIDHLSSFGCIISEESGVVDHSNTSVKIILDPIDGSENLLSHVPYYGTSVAYYEEGVCTKAIITNLANEDVFIKDAQGLRKGTLHSKTYALVRGNPYAKVGLFERSYCSQKALPLLHALGVKYRSPGAFALSLAYAHEVTFVLYEGLMRSYDVAAGCFMCDDLYTFNEEDIFLVSKDKETFDKISQLFISNRLKRG